MKPRLTIVDAFADAPFRGNPAAVCLLAELRETEWLHGLARELDFPATAFVAPDGGAGETGLNHYQLRWFTAAKELVLCGHGTLASAHVLWEGGHADAAATLRFSTKSGVLGCTQRDGWVAMDFPSEPITSTDAPPPGLIEALGVEPMVVGRNRLDYLVEVESAAAVRAATPDFAALREVPTRGVILTAPADAAPHDFVSRFFAPLTGIDEDDATGSAHCCLGPFWAERLGKRDLTGYQASPRGAVIRVRVADKRVELLGQAVTIVHGHLAI